MKRVALACSILLALAGSAVWAQYGTPETLKAELSGSDLAFTDAAPASSAVAGLANRLMAPNRPDAQRVPGLVILPTCGGISEHIGQWSDAALRAGYAVLSVDSLRGLKNDCGSPSQISNGRYIKDALDAVAYMAGQPYVDNQRIAVLGFSKGALVATWTASSKVANILRPGTPPIAAAASLYGLCALGRTRARPQGIQILQPDTDRPLLMLLGGKDNELPPASCLEILPGLKAAGATVFWHVYPQATHAWDKAEQDGFTKTTFSGETVTYHFDRLVTEDSRKRVFEFLAAQKKL